MPAGEREVMYTRPLTAVETERREQERARIKATREILAELEGRFHGYWGEAP